MSLISNQPLHQTVTVSPVEVGVCFRPSAPGSGTLCASWQCLEVPRGPPPSLAVQFVGSGASLSGMDLELVGGRYRMSLVKRRFATGDLNAVVSLQATFHPPFLLCVS